MRRFVAWRMLMAMSVALPLVIHAQAISTPAAASGGATAITAQGGLSAAEVTRLAQDSTQRVIVILRDQHADLTARGAARANRLSVVAADQASILSELAQLHAPRVHAFYLVNAIAATVSAAEAARLATNAQVQAVVPDQTIQGPPSRREQAASTGAPAVGTLVGTTPCTTTSPSLEPEALQLTHTAFKDPAIPQAQNKATGAGVVVAFIAEGLDINNPDFIRADGSHVFVDYQDFSGDGPNAPTGGGEAFGDASSIAAQGRVTYDLNKFVNTVHQGSTPCPITVRGMAPGASLMGLKAFGQANTTTTSNFVQAIEYAVGHGADVINESFGENYNPDNANDPTTLANDAAVAAGVAVTASSGDAGTAGTIGSPSTNPNVIAVGATTQFREYIQTVRHGAQLGSLVGGHNDWVSNNISSFSSSGVAESGRQTIDLVMPGDSSYEVCTPNVALYASCTDFNSQPSNLGFFAGTSESAPLAAGEIALIIQAYRQTHGGASPSPALIKTILKSTATDLGIPSYEQGAGLGNSLKAVRAAASFGISPAQGNALLVSPNLLTAEGLPNTPQTFPLRVTNDGAAAQVVKPYVRALARPFYRASLTPTLDPATAPTFLDHVGTTTYYAQQDFTVPAGAHRLDAAISWGDVTNQPGALVRLDLFDPQGRFTAFTYPSNPAPYTTQRYGHVDVRLPQAGVWHAFVTTRMGSTVYHGLVHLDLTASRFVVAGTVSPTSCSVAPGQSCAFSVTTRIPASAGDQTAEVGFTGVDDGAGAGAVPIILRSLVQVGQTFTGTLTGGNGRIGGNAPGQVLTYNVDVPAGQHDLGLSLGITDTLYNLEGVLVDPNGTPLDVQSTVTSFAPNGVPATYTNTMQFFRRDPQPGRWKFVLLVNGNTSGEQTTLDFAARFTLNTVSVGAVGVPNDPGVTLAAGVPTTATVVVKNTGVTTKDFFVDPRLAATTDLSLGGYSQPIPLPAGLFPPQFFVPTESSQLVIAAQSTGPTVPINMDISTLDGTGPGGATVSPNIYATTYLDPLTGNYAAVAISAAPEVVPGFWGAGPNTVGPYPDGYTSTSIAQVGGVAHTQQFDLAALPGTGDLIALLTNGQSLSTYHPLTLAPGATGTITVQITPNAAPGTVVHGFLYVDTLGYDPSSGFLVTGAGDELIAVPYTYTVK